MKYMNPNKCICVEYILECYLQMANEPFTNSVLWARAVHAPPTPLSDRGESKPFYFEPLNNLLKALR